MKRLSVLPSLALLLALACSTLTPSSSPAPQPTSLPPSAEVPAATAAPLSTPGPQPDTFWVTNPASGARLYVEIVHPVHWDGSPLPAFILVPGGNGFSADFKKEKKSAQALADGGYTVIIFDPDGRGQSDGSEDYGGFIHQDGLAAITRFAATLPEVDAAQIGYGSFSFGVTIASGALARYPDLPIRFLIDWEGPADRTDTGGCGSDGVKGHLANEASCDDESFWARREAVTFIAQIRVPYQRMQTEKDHVQPDYEHSVKMVNAAVNGGAPWVRLNDLPPNQTYNLATLPRMLPEPFERDLMKHYAEYAAELLALPPATPVGPASTPTASPGGLREHERSFLPQVTAVEKWTEIGVISERQNFAPSIVKLREGGYRIFWNDPPKGITSASSPDGIRFTADGGVRLGNGQGGSPDCIASHPWVIAVEGGYRMYYQGNEDCEPTPGEPPIYRIFSAFSAEGLNFSREGVRVDIGAATGLTQAAHGRVLRLADGTYRMYFSANFIGKDAPADVLGASSADGLTWALDAAPTLERAHDPTVIQIGGAIYLYTTFLGDNFVILESADGYAFTPTTWVEFYNQNGARIEEFGDADILMTDDGRLLIYGSGKGSPGLSVCVREAATP